MASKFYDLQEHLFTEVLDHFGDIEYPVGRDKIVEIKKVALKALKAWIEKNCQPVEYSGGGWRMLIKDEDGDCLAQFVFADYDVAVIYSFKEEALEVTPLFGHILFPSGRPGQD